MLLRRGFVVRLVCCVVDVLVCYVVGSLCCLVVAVMLCGVGVLAVLLCRCVGVL